MTSWPVFEIGREDRDGATWLIVSGELDMSAAPRLNDAVDGLAAETAPITVDLAAVSFCDSSGLAALLRARRRVGGLTLKPGEGVRRVAELACVAELLFGPKPAARNDTGLEANGG